MDLHLFDMILNKNHDVYVEFTDRCVLRLKQDGIPVSIYENRDVKNEWGTLITVEGFVITTPENRHEFYPWQSVLKVVYWKTK